jgi:hypothetical protein
LNKLLRESDTKEAVEIKLLDDIINTPMEYIEGEEDATKEGEEPKSN